MVPRGWTRKDIEEALERPKQAIAVRDVRFLLGGSRLDDPATAFIRPDGHYVVRNDATGDIVQISDRLDPEWKAPWDLPPLNS